MSKKKYTHIKFLPPEILVIKEAGKTKVKQELRRDIIFISHIVHLTLPFDTLIPFVEGIGTGILF